MTLIYALARRTRTVIAAALLGGVVVCSAGCNDAESGALLGGLGGAGLGAIIGHQSGHGGEGALIGAGAGALLGYIVGNESDKDRQQAYQNYYGPSGAPTTRRVYTETTYAQPVYREYHYRTYYGPRYHRSYYHHHHHGHHHHGGVSFSFGSGYCPW